MGHVNAHGTATLAGDKAEATSLAQVYGAHGIPVTANKSLFGHLLGASGAVELFAVLSSLQNALIPPQACESLSDPALEIDLVGKCPRPSAGAHVMSNSFAFGGTNAVLIASRV